MKQLMVIGSMVMALVACVAPGEPASSQESQDPQDSQDTQDVQQDPQATPAFGADCYSDHFSCVISVQYCFAHGGKLVPDTCGVASPLQCCTVG